MASSWTPETWRDSRSRWLGFWQRRTCGAVWVRRAAGSRKDMVLKRLLMSGRRFTARCLTGDQPREQANGDQLRGAGIQRGEAPRQHAERDHSGNKPGGL